MDINKNPSEESKLNENYISLWFSNFNFPLEDITNLLKLTPTKTALKGHEYIVGRNTTNPRTLIRKFTFWEYCLEINTNDFIGDIADKFVLDTIKPRIESIKNLTKSTSAEFKIVQYYYNGHNPGYHFAPEILQIIVEANLSIDIDTYCVTKS